MCNRKQNKTALHLRTESLLKRFLQFKLSTRETATQYLQETLSNQIYTQHSTVRSSPIYRTTACYRSASIHKWWSIKTQPFTVFIDNSGDLNILKTVYIILGSGTDPTSLLILFLLLLFFFFFLFLGRSF